jgi:uncharacterized protein YndB with AHSA1/START domain
MNTERISMHNTSKLTKVAAHGDRELVISREFDAPRQLIFDAHTKPELIRRWLLGPAGWTMPVCEVDLRVGGKYRYVWRNQKGMDMGMGGEYREIVAPERIVSTEQFDEAWYPGVAVGTLTLVEHAGKTLLTQVMQYETGEARDAVLKSPMEEGLEAGYSRLSELLAKGTVQS